MRGVEYVVELRFLFITAFVYSKVYNMVKYTWYFSSGSRARNFGGTDSGINEERIAGATMG